MRGILRSLPSQPTINSSARIGNRFIPRPDELVSYGGGAFDADRPYPLMTAKSGADGVLNAPVFHGTPVSRLWETTRPVRGMGALAGVYIKHYATHGDTNLHGGIQTRAHAEGESV
jgi:hypothetical protein